jgi:hypothetical protein
LSSVIAPKPVRVLINDSHARTDRGVIYLRNMPLLTKDPMLDVHFCAHEDQQDILPQNIEYHLLNFPASKAKCII